MEVVMSCDFWVDNTGPSLNVANGNAHIVCWLLGVAGNEYSMTTDRILDAIDHVIRADSNEMCRATEQHDNVVMCGCSVDQINFYKVKLIMILNYALNHNKIVMWG